MSDPDNAQSLAVTVLALLLVVMLVVWILGE